ncbi:MAG: FAD-binding protein [Bacteroidales bacterium]|nr:FAD-binding protein [Bacteroidales bacterium]
MKRFGLIGHPIAHSLSPALFRAGYSGKYPYDLIEGEDFGAAFRRFMDSYDGINVTAPFKELAFAKADILSEECRLTAAANIMVKTPSGIKAHNSDYLGIRKWLEDEAVPRVRQTASGPTVLVAGCGGAGKAAAFAAASLGLQTVIMNRDIVKAERIAASSPGMFTVRPLDAFPESFNECGIIIYTVPSAIPALDSIAQQRVGNLSAESPRIIMEANYRNPAFTPQYIMKLQNAWPATYYAGGRTWLLYQALTGYEILTGEKPDLAKMHTCL